MDEPELVCELAPDLWSRGLATEAGHACLRYAFENTRMERVIAGANPRNLASFRIMGKLGMNPIGNINPLLPKDPYFALDREAADNAASRKESMIVANGVRLCAQAFGAPTHPAILLLAGTGCSMDWWDDEFCERLAGGSRFVIRYDQRDTGRSVSYEPGAPPYTLRDLAADAVGLLDTYGLSRAHLVGMSMGGWVAQLAALDHPHRVATLVLLSTRSTPHGPADPDLPEVSETLMAHFAEPIAEPDWADREAVIDYLVAGDRPFAGSLPFDEARKSRLAGRVFDRTESLVSSMTNHTLVESGERWRERLSEIAAPTLVIHGTEDPLFPPDNARALASEIPAARLLMLNGVGHEMPPPSVWDLVIPAIVDHTSERRTP